MDEMSNIENGSELESFNRDLDNKLEAIEKRYTDEGLSSLSADEIEAKAGIALDVLDRCISFCEGFEAAPETGVKLSERDAEVNKILQQRLGRITGCLLKMDSQDGKLSAEMSAKVNGTFGRCIELIPPEQLDRLITANNYQRFLGLLPTIALDPTDTYQKVQDSLIIFAGRTIEKDPTILNKDPQNNKEAAIIADISDYLQLEIKPDGMPVEILNEVEIVKIKRNLQTAEKISEEMGKLGVPSILNRKKSKERDNLQDQIDAIAAKCSGSLSSILSSSNVGQINQAVRTLSRGKGHFSYNDLIAIVNDASVRDTRYIYTKGDLDAIILISEKLGRDDIAVKARLRLNNEFATFPSSITQTSIQTSQLQLQQSIQPQVEQPKTQEERRAEFQDKLAEINNRIDNRFESQTAQDELADALHDAFGITDVSILDTYSEESLKIEKTSDGHVVVATPNSFENTSGVIVTRHPKIEVPTSNGSINFEDLSEARFSPEGVIESAKVGGLPETTIVLPNNDKIVLDGARRFDRNSGILEIAFNAEGEMMQVINTEDCFFNVEIKDSNDQTEFNAIKVVRVNLEDEKIVITLDSNSKAFLKGKSIVGGGTIEYNLETGDFTYTTPERAKEAEGIAEAPGEKESQPQSVLEKYPWLAENFQENGIESQEILSKEEMNELFEDLAKVEGQSGLDQTKVEFLLRVRDAIDANDSFYAAYTEYNENKSPELEKAWQNAREAKNSALEKIGFKNVNGGFKRIDITKQGTLIFEGPQTINVQGENWSFRGTTNLDSYGKILSVNIKDHQGYEFTFNNQTKMQVIKGVEIEVLFKDNDASSFKSLDGSKPLILISNNTEYKSQQIDLGDDTATMTLKEDTGEFLTRDIIEVTLSSGEVAKKVLSESQLQEQGKTETYQPIPQEQFDALIANINTNTPWTPSEGNELYYNSKSDGYLRVKKIQVAEGQYFVEVDNASSTNNFRSAINAEVLKQKLVTRNEPDTLEESTGTPEKLSGQESKIESLDQKLQEYINTHQIWETFHVILESGQELNEEQRVQLRGHFIEDPVITSERDIFALDKYIAYLGNNLEASQANIILDTLASARINTKYDAEAILKLVKVPGVDTQKIISSCERGLKVKNSKEADDMYKQAYLLADREKFETRFKVEIDSWKAQLESSVVAVSSKGGRAEAIRLINEQLLSPSFLEYLKEDTDVRNQLDKIADELNTYLNNRINDSQVIEKIGNVSNALNILGVLNQYGYVNAEKKDTLRVTINTVLDSVNNASQGQPVYSIGGIVANITSTGLQEILGSQKSIEVLQSFLPKVSIGSFVEIAVLTALSKLSWFPTNEEEKSAVTSFLNRNQTIQGYEIGARMVGNLRRGTEVKDEVSGTGGEAPTGLQQSEQVEGKGAENSLAAFIGDNPDSSSNGENQAEALDRNIFTFLGEGDEAYFNKLNFDNGNIFNPTDLYIEPTTTVENRKVYKVTQVSKAEDTNGTSTYILATADGREYSINADLKRVAPNYNLYLRLEKAQVAEKTSPEEESPNQLVTTAQGEHNEPEVSTSTALAEQTREILIEQGYKQVVEISEDNDKRSMSQEFQAALKNASPEKYVQVVITFSDHNEIINVTGAEIKSNHDDILATNVPTIILNEALNLDGTPTSDETIADFNANLSSIYTLFKVIKNPQVEVGQESEAPVQGQAEITPDEVAVPDADSPPGDNGINKLTEIPEVVERLTSKGFDEILGAGTDETATESAPRIETLEQLNIPPQDVVALLQSIPAGQGELELNQEQQFYFQSESVTNPVKVVRIQRALNSNGGETPAINLIDEEGKVLAAILPDKLEGLQFFKSQSESNNENVIEPEVKPMALEPISFTNLGTIWSTSESINNFSPGRKLKQPIAVDLNGVKVVFTHIIKDDSGIVLHINSSKNIDPVKVLSVDQNMAIYKVENAAPDFSRSEVEAAINETIDVSTNDAKAQLTAAVQTIIDLRSTSRKGRIPTNKENLEIDARENLVAASVGKLTKTNEGILVALEFIKNTNFGDYYFGQRIRRVVTQVKDFEKQKIIFDFCVGNEELVEQILPNYPGENESWQGFYQKMIEEVSEENVLRAIYSKILNAIGYRIIAGTLDEGSKAIINIIAKDPNKLFAMVILNRDKLNILDYMFKNQLINKEKLLQALNNIAPSDEPNETDKLYNQFERINEIIKDSIVIEETITFLKNKDNPENSGGWGNEQRRKLLEKYAESKGKSYYDIFRPLMDDSQFRKTVIDELSIQKTQLDQKIERLKSDLASMYTP